MQTLQSLLILLLPVSLAAEEADEYLISSPTPEQIELYDLDEDFYRKCATVQGILIATSERVSDLAIREAAYQFDMVMRRINADVANRIRERNVLCVLIAHDELTSQVPQFATDKSGQGTRLLQLAAARLPLAQQERAPDRRVRRGGRAGVRGRHAAGEHPGARVRPRDPQRRL